MQTFVRLSVYICLTLTMSSTLDASAFVGGDTETVWRSLYKVQISAESLRLPSAGQRVPSGRETPRGETNSDPQDNHPSKAPHRDPSVQEPGRRRQPRPCCPQPRPSKGPDPREGSEESHPHQEEVDESTMSWRDVQTPTGLIRSRWS